MCFVLVRRPRGACWLHPPSACREACLPAAIPWKDPWRIAENLGSCYSRCDRALDGCQLQLATSFPSGNGGVEYQELPTEEMVSDIPPFPSGDNELEPSDLLSRKERTRVCALGHDSVWKRTPGWQALMKEHPPRNYPEHPAPCHGLMLLSMNLR